MEAEGFSPAGHAGAEKPTPISYPPSPAQLLPLRAQLAQVALDR
jgi:hypothetical protein